jgi:sialate O-acetylesterase
MSRVAAFALATLIAGSAEGAPAFHALFQDNLVLQRNQPINIWGTAAPNERLSITLASATRQTRADASGKWTVGLPAMQAGGPYSLSAKGESGPEITVANVLVGEVWLCAGQSNMVLQLHRALNARQELEDAKNETIRMLTIPLGGNATPQDTFPGPVAWHKTEPALAREFSATCFYFARELQKTVTVPMGLIVAAWGGSRVQAWTSAAAVPPQPEEPPRPSYAPPDAPGAIRNAMIAPLKNLAIHGILWYQGEANTGPLHAGNYQDLLRRFMADWREQFGSHMPFLIVQLANYGPQPTAPVESGWAQVREAQRLAVKQDANARLTVSIDIGDAYDLHPANKQEVGRRLARAARNLIYGEALPPSGPVVQSARKQGDQVIVTFGDVTGRLITYSSTRPIGFELCSAEPGSCRYVEATIDQSRVSLDASEVEAPSRVRYCWADSPVCTLFDEARLPAGPFQIQVQ